MVRSFCFRGRLDEMKSDQWLRRASNSRSCRPLPRYLQRAVDLAWDYLVELHLF